MKILEGAIVDSAKKGYLSLQVPDIAIGYPQPPMVDAPDEWFVVLTGERPVIGRETGFLYLSRKGYEANKKLLRDAIDGNPRGITWEQFESAAEAHFAKVKTKTQKYVDQLQSKLETIKEKMEMLED